MNFQNKIIAGFLVLLLLSLNSCCKNHGDILPDLDFVGNPGNPRFNLQFDNEINVDLDLYVRTPLGDVISYQNTYSSLSEGQLDIDCLCSNCPNGPNENIFFPLDGSSPKGIYEYWVDFYGDCNGPEVESNFTLRLIKINTILRTHEGKLSSGISEIWKYEHD